jgi:hypothetical protein
VLQICDILVRIRLQILLFSSQWPSRRKQSFFAYYFLKVHLHHFFKDKKSQSRYKTRRIKVFLTTVFCLMIEGSGSPNIIRILNGIRLRKTGFSTKKPDQICNIASLHEVRGWIRNGSESMIQDSELRESGSAPRPTCSTVDHGDCSQEDASSRNYT